MRRRSGFGSAGVPPAPCFFKESQHRRPFLRQDEQDAGATSPRCRVGPAKFPGRSASTRTAWRFKLPDYVRQRVIYFWFSLGGGDLPTLRFAPIVISA